MMSRVLKPSIIHNSIIFKAFCLHFQLLRIDFFCSSSSSSLLTFNCYAEAYSNNDIKEHIACVHEIIFGGMKYLHNKKKLYMRQIPYTNS